MNGRIEPGQPVIIKHVGGGVFGVKERKGVLLNVVTVRDEVGTHTTLNVAISGVLQEGREVVQPQIMSFGSDNRQLAAISEWRLQAVKS